MADHGFLKKFSFDEQGNQYKNYYTAESVGIACGFLLAALHWRAIEEPIGMPHALSGLPGTVGWRTRPRLHGFRCATCSIVTFKYGDRPTPGGPAPGR